MLAAALCAGQEPAHYFEVRLPAEVRSESVFIRYVLAGEKFGEWVPMQAGVSSYRIETTQGIGFTRGIKAIVYAPGCTIQTIDLTLSGSNYDSYSFFCHPLGTTMLAGRMRQANRLKEPGPNTVRLQMQYLARWAAAFLGLGKDIPLVIPLGNPATVSADGEFEMSVPDFANDPLAGASQESGELQIRALDAETGDQVGLVIPSGPLGSRTRFGGLPIQRNYSSFNSFGLCENGSRYGKEGFAIRPLADPCDLPELFLHPR